MIDVTKGGRATEIERIGRPTRQEFERYVEANRPVVMTDVSPHWEAMKRWDLAYLKRVAGSTPVTVHHDKDGNFTRWYLSEPGTRDDRKIPFGDLLDMLQTDEGRRFYMTEHSLREISPVLAQDVDVTDLIDLTPPWEPLLFVGRDTCMPLHYHGTTEAILCQLIGTKQITLYAPDQTPYLYPVPWYAQSPLFSRVDGRSIQAGQPDFERWPKLRKAVPLQFTLHPGEILFIPVHWWHLTSVPTFQVSMTTFWQSRFRRWTFPSPGLQVCAREVVYQIRTRLGAKNGSSAYGR